MMLMEHEDFDHSGVPRSQAHEASGEARVEKKDTTVEALGKVGNFLDRLYGGRVPEIVISRLARLKEADTIIVSNESLRERLLASGKRPIAAEVTRAFYDGEADKIYFPEDATLNEKIHEILHFVSSRPEEGFGKSGIKQKIGDGEKVFLKGTLLNEMMTVALSVAVEQDIDLTRGNFSALQLSRGLRTFLERKVHPLGMSYKTAVENFRLQIIERGELRDGLLDFAKSYLLADPTGFDGALEKRVGKGGVRVFKESVLREPKDRICAFFRVYAGELSEFSSVGRFIEALSGEDRNVDVDFDFPEDARGIFTVVPRLKQFGTMPQIRVNLLLHDALADREFRKDYFDINQVRAYILWQAVKLDAAKRGELLTDDSFFQNEEIRRFLSTRGMKIERIQKMARKLLRAEMTEGDLERILTVQSPIFGKLVR